MRRKQATRSASAVALFALCGWMWLIPASASAVPKLDIKVFLGVGSTTLVPRVPEFTLPSGTVVGGRVSETRGNWQGGLSARVRFDKAFAEIGMVFSRFGFTIPESELEICQLQNAGNPDACLGLEEIIGKDGRMNSFEIPMTAGYVPYRNPYFGLFLYGGLVNKFNIRGFVETNGSRKGLKFKPTSSTRSAFVWAGSSTSAR
ncbi:MAG: hypothetical protein JRJ24_20535 [Deltaproteobacteria bacterium]|nr:hypothetical protein [Deltaproteobacteria bacterium]